MSAEQAGSNDPPEHGRPRPRVWAVCPINVNHKAIVYKTIDSLRFCKCNDCGRTWKQTGPRATDPPTMS